MSGKEPSISAEARPLGRSIEVELWVGRLCVAFCKWYASAAVFSMLGVARVKGILP
jgi:hypothetical protein